MARAGGADRAAERRGARQRRPVVGNEMTERPLPEATGTRAPAGAPVDATVDVTGDTTDNDTFPKLLARNALLRGSRPAMREKDYGIWQTSSWAEAAD